MERGGGYTEENVWMGMSEKGGEERGRERAAEEGGDGSGGCKKRKM